MFNAIAMIGPETALIVLVAVLVLFGGKKIPELMRGVGQGVGELKKGMEDGHRTIMQAAQPEENKPTESPAPTTTPAAPTTTPGAPTT